MTPLAFSTIGKAEKCEEDGEGEHRLPGVAAQTEAPHERRAAVGQGRVVGAARHVAVPLLVVVPLLRNVVVFQRRPVQPVHV